MLKIRQNWSKIANYPPPMLNKDLHPWRTGHGVEWKMTFPCFILAIFFHSILKIFDSILHSILKVSSIFHSILPCQRTLRLKATQLIVEDTTFEDKGSKKIRDQGLTFRKQTLSRTRTGMVEAKA